MIELASILEGLIQRTTEGKLKWTRSALENQFITSIDTISIVVLEEEDRWGSPRYRLNIFGEKEEMVDSLGFPDYSETQDLELKRLYILARRSTNNAEATLEKLAKALDI